MGVVKEEEKMGGVKGEEGGYTVRWRPKVRYGESSREKLKDEEEEATHHNKQITEMCPLAHNYRFTIQLKFFHTKHISLYFNTFSGLVGAAHARLPTEWRKT